MSFESSVIALHHSRASGSTLLVLLGIANHDGDGGAWPSVGTLARYARISPSQVQRCVKKLVELGEIARHVQKGGDYRVDDWRRPNRYDFLLTCPPDCDRTKNHRTVRTSGVVLPTFDPDEAEHLKPGITYPQSYPQGAAPMRPGRTHAGGTGRTHATQTNPPITNHERSVDNLQTARTRASCGHELIVETDGRHCVYGCRIPKDER